MRNRYSLKTIYNLVISILVLAFSHTAFGQTLETDQPDYPPGATVILTGTGFMAGETVILQVLHDNYSGGIDSLEAHIPWLVDADGDGSFTTSWYIPEDGDEGNATLIATAMGELSGSMAQVIFTDAACIGPTIITNPDGGTKCVGESISFSVSVNANGTGTLSYQWRKNNVVIAGATNSTYSISNIAVADAGSYTLTVTRAGCTTPATSSAAVLAVNTVSPGAIAGTQIICGGVTPSIISSATNGSGGGTITYQWEASLDNISWVTLNGATGASFSPGPLTVTRYYRRTTISTLNGKACSALGNAVTVTVASYNVTGAAITHCGSFTLPWGQNVTASGNYTHTYASVLGCDSIVSIHVTIRPSYNLIGTPVSSCGSYTLPWGQTVASSGNYGHTYSSIAGCDSTVTIPVTITSGYNVNGASATACGSFILPWGETVTTTGDYDYNYSTASGCDSVVNIHVTINQGYNVNADAVSACGNYELPWGQNALASGDYNHAYSSVNGCDSVVNMHVTINQPYNINGGDVSACGSYELPWGENAVATGNYSHTYASVNGCDSVVNIHATINQAYNVNGTPVEACGNYNLPWGQNVTATGDYTHVYSSIHGCDSAVAIHVIINSNYNITAQPVTACSSYTLPWNHIVTVTGDYNQTYTSIHGCDSIVNIHVTINQGYNIAGAPVVACSSYTLPWGQNVNASGNYSHTYSSVDGCDSTISTQVTINPAYNNISLEATSCDSYLLPWGSNVTASGNYSHTYSSVNGCDSTVTVHATINHSYEIEAPLTGCNNVALPWGDVAILSGDYSHMYHTATSCDSNVVFHVTINNGYNNIAPAVSNCGSFTLPWNEEATVSGNYSHTYSSVTGCDSIVTIPVAINSGYDVTGEPVTECVSYILPWNEDVTATGNYSHTYSSVNGCDSIVTIHVNINSSYDVTGDDVSSCDNYTLPWGQVAEASGNYSNTYNSVTGCDSIVSIHVTINPSYNLINAGISACGSYTLPWGSTVTISGDYSHGYTSVSGCDSIVTVPVIVNSNYSSSENAVSCDGYTLPWGEIANTSGDYDHNYYSVTGCDSVLTVHVTVNHSYNVNGGNVTAVNHYTLPWGQNVVATGYYNNTYTSVSGCDSTVTIHVVIHPSYDVSGGSVTACVHFILPWGTNVTSSGNYTHTYTSILGTDSVVTIHVTINPKYNITGAPVSACTSYTLPWGLDVQSSGDYSHNYYTVNGCDSILNIHVSINPVYNIDGAPVTACNGYTLPWGQHVTASGTYSNTYTSAKGCDSTVNISVTINPNYDLFGAPVIVCSNYQLPWGQNVTASGNYNHTYSSVNGCDSIITIPVTINSAYNITQSAAVACTNYTLPWGQNVTASGNYSHTYSSINGCDSVVTIPVTINSAPTATASSNGQICQGGSLNFHSDGGSSYSWSGPNGFSSALQNPSINNASTLASGIYTVVVTNTSGCSASANTSVTVNPNPAPTASANGPLCAGGSLLLNSTGSGTYSWIGPNGFNSLDQNPVLSNAGTLASGIYTVTATNAYGCSATASVSATVNAKPVVVVSNGGSVCAGGSLSLSASGGASYSWSGPNGFASNVQNPVITNATTAASGTYTVTAANSYGCTASSTTSAVVNAKPVATASGNSALCSGGAINLSSGGGNSYAWTGPSGFTSLIQNPVISNATTSASGVYSVTATNSSGCTATASVSVTVSAKPTATASSNSPVCSGSNLNLSASGGGTYAWSGPNGFSSTLQNPSIANASAATAGTYNVTVTNASGCTATASVAVALNSMPTPCSSNGGSQQYEYIDYVNIGTISRTSGADAGGYYNGTSLITNVSAGSTYTLTVSPGFTSNAYNESWSVYIDWTGDGDFSDANETASLSTTGSGNYTISIAVPSTASMGNKRMRVSVHYGCGGSACGSFGYGEVEDYTLNVVPTASSNSPVCAGSTLNLSASGASSYSWSGPNGFSSTLQNPTISNVTSAAAGTYTVAVTNSSGCSVAIANTVVVNVKPNASASNNAPMCAGNTMNLSSSGGAAYSWSGPNGFTSTQQNPSISNVSTAASGNYTVTVSNSSGCTATASTSATINAKPTSSASSNSPVCANNALNLSSSGGGSYSWSGPNGFSSTLQNPSITHATTAAGGTYTVTVTNSSGCSSTASTTVTVNGATASSNGPVCASSTLNLSASGGSSYSWSGPNGFTSAQQNPTISNVSTLATGTYTVTTTVSCGCTTTATVAVTVNSKPTVSASSNSPVCAASTLNLSASGGTSYSWSGPNGFSSTLQNPSISSVTTTATGTYTVTVSNSSGCTSTGTTSVTVNGTATASSNSPVCVGSTLNLSASGGTSYSWSGPNGFSSSLQNPSINNVATTAGGTYTVVVTSSCGGAVSKTTSVSVNAKPTASASGNSPVCAGSTLSLGSSGGSSYSWAGPNSFSSSVQNPSISNIATAAGGTYTVTVTNSSGCSSTATKSVTVNAKPTPTIGSNTPVCTGSTITLSSSGGTSYSWSGPNGFHSTQQNPSIGNAQSCAEGTYTVTVTNSSGCTSTASTYVDVGSGCGCHKDGSASITPAVNVNIYPNPSDGVFMIQLNFNDATTQTVSLEIVNMLGQSIYLDHAAAIDGLLEKEVKLERDVIPGTYFIQLTSGNEIYTKQIVFQR